MEVEEDGLESSETSFDAQSATKLESTAFITYLRVASKKRTGTMGNKLTHVLTGKSMKITGMLHDLHGAWLNRVWDSCDRVDPSCGLLGPAGTSGE